MNEIIDPLLKIVPEKYRWPLLAALVIVPQVCRAWHALSSGAGLVGAFRGVLFGTNQPKSVVADPAKDDPRQGKLGIPLMALMVGSSIMLAGCAFEFHTKGNAGVSITPTTPPTNSIVRFTVRSIGLHVGQNQATQTPEATLGYNSATYDRVPVGMGQTVYAPSVKGTIGVSAKALDPSINESFTVGNTNAP